MTLLVTLFLVMINIFNNISTASPLTDGITLIMSWILICLLFIFAALMAYAGILFKLSHIPTMDIKDARWNGMELRFIDNILVILFPVLFLIVSVIYWSLVHTIQK
jgi:hypothetical protein